MLKGVSRKALKSKLGEYYLPMVAMSHSGDENGTSTYGFKLFGIYREPISKD